jgi:hypothetical protein
VTQRESRLGRPAPALYLSRQGRGTLAGMTEAEWRTSDDPGAMLVFLRGRASERKLRLFACACCRWLWGHFLAEECRQAVEVAERFADGRATEEQLRQAHCLAGRANDAYRCRAHAAPFAATQHPLRREEGGGKRADYTWLASAVFNAGLRLILPRPGVR